MLTYMLALLNCSANESAVSESVPLETMRLPDGDDPSLPPRRDSGDDLLVVINNLASSMDSPWALMLVFLLDLAA